MKKLYFVIPIIIILVTLATLSIIYLTRSTSDTMTYHTSIMNETQLKSLPQKDASDIDTSHLGVNVTPPTNKWFSGIALQKKPQAVFPTPLSFTPTESSFTFDLPDTATGSLGISAIAHQPVEVMIKDATRYTVTRYDETSVDLAFGNVDHNLGTITLVAGVPYIYFSAANDTTLTVNGGATVTNNSLTYTLKDVVTKLAAFDGAQVQDAQTITVPRGGLVTMYAAKTESIQKLDENAMNRIESTSVAYKKEGDDVRTTIRYNTANDKATYYGRLPHQQDTAKGKTFATIYGPLVVESGNNLSFTTPDVPVSDSLDLSKLSSDERRDLTQTVRQEINAPHEYPDDSYFGGKALYRDAQLLSLAKQLGETDAATTIQRKLRDGLLAWITVDNTKAKSLYYDTKIHGIVGITPSFGSEEFNDHHFHYGYFIYAAAILAQYDSDFKASYKDQVNLLVADIANYRTGEKLPLRRNFDPYFGHSWASGSSPFADGNNQESSSEAINAWIGVELWAKQIGNSELADNASWMLSNEVASTSAYWMNFDRSQAPYNAGYDHSVVALNWGAKRDYATFFSAEPRAMLGIQLLPMSPTTQYMSQYGSRITEQLKEARALSDSGQFDDYLLMYESLRGVTDQLDRAKKLPDTAIDSANSRSYMYAWIMSRQ